MSAYLLGHAFKCRMGTQSAKLVLLKMVDACEDDGTRIYPSVAKIAEAAECSRRHAQRTVRMFEEIGLIELVREGGNGPRRTNEYRLLVDELLTIEKIGWPEYVERKHSENNGLTESDMRSPMDGEKGDTIESPSELLRATSGADKGDSSCRPTPTDPSEDSLSAAPGEREKASPSNIQFMPPRAIDNGEGRSFVLRLAKAYPTGFADNLDEAQRAADGLTPEERRAAERDLLRWVEFCRAQGRRHLPGLAGYLRDKRWELLPAPPKPVDDGKIEVKRYSRAFWALFWRHDQAERDPESFWLQATTRAWRVESRFLPTEAEEAGLVAIDVAGPAFDAWSDYVCRRWPSMRFRFRRPDKATVIWCPSETPPPPARETTPAKETANA